MLLIRCARCRRKLWKYEKFGKGELLRCHKTRIIRTYQMATDGTKIICSCGKEIGNDKGNYIGMIRGAFTYSGTKQAK